jgi:hypothetical protein
MSALFGDNNFAVPRKIGELGLLLSFFFGKPFPFFGRNTLRRFSFFAAY